MMVLPCCSLNEVITLASDEGPNQEQYYLFHDRLEVVNEVKSLIYYLTV